MPDPAMQPKAEPQPQADAAPADVSAGLTWNGNAVSIGLPPIADAEATRVTWNTTTLTENPSSSRWESGSSNAINSLTAVYPAGTYTNAGVARDETSATLTKA